MRTYLHNLLVACDQLVNALMGGWPDETLSSRCWRWHVSGVRHWPCRWLDGLAALLGEAEHCRQSYESECTGGQLPPELH